jgi:hypothetical protein
MGIHDDTSSMGERPTVFALDHFHGTFRYYSPVDGVGADGTWKELRLIFVHIFNSEVRFLLKGVMIPAERFILISELKLYPICRRSIESTRRMIRQFTLFSNATSSSCSVLLADKTSQSFASN